MKVFGVLLALTLFVGCSSTPGVNVTPQTKDDMAACGMGVSSQTAVAVRAAIEVEKNSGEVTGGLRDELKTEFLKNFRKEDALAASDRYLECMKGRSSIRREAQKVSAIQTCKASWTCNFNQVSGFCLCNDVTKQIQKEQGLSEFQTAKLIASNCTANFAQCWPDGNVHKGRADCEVVLSEAKIALPKKSANKICTYEWEPT